MEYSPHSHDVSESPQPIQVARSQPSIPIDFLLNTQDDIISRFPVRESTIEESELGDEATLADFQDSPGKPQWGEDYESSDVFFGADMTLDDFFHQLPLSIGLPASHTDFSPHVLGQGCSTLTSALEGRAYELRQLLHQRASEPDGEFETVQFQGLGPAIEHITAHEVESCVSLYFQYYHRHCPIVHVPTFNAMIVAPPLLMSMVALGGMYSKDPTKLTWVRALLDLMESYIFTTPGLRRDAEETVDLSVAHDERMAQYQYEIFQGAYLLIVTQYFSGNHAARRRQRRHRFSKVLTV